MVNTVREHGGARKTSLPPDRPRTVAFMLASTVVGEAAINQSALLMLGLFGVLVIACVVVPAVWSSDTARRRAALAVLERLLRWRG